MKRRGRGMATMWYPIGFTVAANPSAAVVKVNEDGTATLLTGTVETGQGSLTILAQIERPSPKPAFGEPPSSWRNFSKTTARWASQRHRSA